MRSAFLVICSAAVVACAAKDSDCERNTDIVGDGFDQNCDGIDGTDVDGDGLASTESGGDDCDDHDAAVLPGTDADGDGFLACEDDCDDASATTHPGAIDVCNDVDDNCSGAVDAQETYDEEGKSCGAVVVALYDVSCAAFHIGATVDYEDPDENLGGGVLRAYVEVFQADGSFLPPEYHEQAFPLAIDYPGTASIEFDVEELGDDPGSHVNVGTMLVDRAGILAGSWSAGCDL